MEGKWKLIHYHEDGRDELYDLNKDIGEQNDLIEAEARRAQKEAKSNIYKPKPKKRGLKNNMPIFWKLITNLIKTGGEVQRIERPHLKET